MPFNFSLLDGGSATKIFPKFTQVSLLKANHMHSPPLVLLTFQMGKQLESFKTSLEDFAGKYKQDIRKNPEFRGHFQQMCARIGVDPLACKSRFF